MKGRGALLSSWQAQGTHATRNRLPGQSQFEPLPGRYACLFPPHIIAGGVKCQRIWKVSDMPTRVQVSFKLSQRPTGQRTEPYQKDTEMLTCHSWCSARNVRRQDVCRVILKQAGEVILFKNGGHCLDIPGIELHLSHDRPVFDHPFRQGHLLA